MHYCSFRKENYPEGILKSKAGLLPENGAGCEEVRTFTCMDSSSGGADSGLTVQYSSSYAAAARQRKLVFMTSTAEKFMRQTLEMVLMCCLNGS